MTRAISFAFGVLCLAGGCYTGYLAWGHSRLPDTAQATPGLYAEPPVRDLGGVEQSRTLWTEFRIVNRFSFPITVQDVVTGCSCADAQLDSKSLASGESSTLWVAWKTGRQRGRAGTRVGLRYAGEQGNGGISVEVRGIVIPDLTVEPGELEFDEHRLQTRVVRFTPGRSPRVPRLLATVVNQTAFAVRLDPDGASVHVAFDPAKPGWDAPNLKLSVQTDSASDPWIEVPIRVGRIDRSLDPSPF